MCVSTLDIRSTARFDSRSCASTVDSVLHYIMHWRYKRPMMFSLMGETCVPSTCLFWVGGSYAITLFQTKKVPTNVSVNTCALCIHKNTFKEQPSEVHSTSIILIYLCLFVCSELRLRNNHQKCIRQRVALYNALIFDSRNNAPVIKGASMAHHRCFQRARC
jgi:hypothetical protein